MKAVRLRIRRRGAAIRTSLGAVEEAAALTAASVAAVKGLPAAAWVPAADWAPNPVARLVAAAPVWAAGGPRRGVARLQSM